MTTDARIRAAQPPLLSPAEYESRIRLALSLLRSRLPDHPAAQLVERALEGASIQELTLLDRPRGRC